MERCRLRELSFASFLLMEGRGICEALTHDRNFEQAGFVALLR